MPTPPRQPAPSGIGTKHSSKAYRARIVPCRGDKEKQLGSTPRGEYLGRRSSANRFDLAFEVDLDFAGGTGNWVGNGLSPGPADPDRRG